MLFLQNVLYLCQSHVTFKYWRFKKEGSWLLPKFCEGNHQFHRAAFPWVKLAFCSEVFVMTVLSSPPYLPNFEQQKVPCHLRWSCPAAAIWLCRVVWEHLPFSSWSWCGPAVRRRTPWLAPEQCPIFPPASRLTDVGGQWLGQLQPACVFEELKRKYVLYFLQLKYIR